MKMILASLQIVVMFWNVENYFDPFKDSIKNDLEFTPGGTYHWTWRKFQKKRNDLVKTLFLVGEKYGKMPALIGLAEVENYFVLNQLIYHTSLSKCDYKIIHDESPDPRGIDVALIYDNSRFELLEKEFITIDTLSTRQILYAKGFVRSSSDTTGDFVTNNRVLTDTLYLFVNHWPSKRGGAKASNWKRTLAAGLLMHKIDSIYSVYSDNSTTDPHIIIMGDFNEEPSGQLLQSINPLKLVNIFAEYPKNSGTYKYKGKWQYIDQFILSQEIAKSAILCEPFRCPFILEPDKAYFGQKPFRTYIGPRYNGGVSDHLPIILYL